MKCEQIRACADHGLLARISAASGGARSNLGSQFTAGVVSCLNGQGVKCKKIADDKIDFGTVGGCHIVYDIIQNLHGSGEAHISCHKILTGNCGGEAGEGFEAGEETTWDNPPGNGNDLQTDIEKLLPWAAGALALLIIYKGFSGRGGGPVIDI